MRNLPSASVSNTARAWRHAIATTGSLGRVGDRCVQVGQVCGLCAEIQNQIGEVACQILISADPTNRTNSSAAALVVVAAPFSPRTLTSSAPPPTASPARSTRNGHPPSPPAIARAAPPCGSLLSPKATAFHPDAPLALGGIGEVRYVVDR